MKMKKIIGLALVTAFVLTGTSFTVTKASAQTTYTQVTTVTTYTPKQLTPAEQAQAEALLTSIRQQLVNILGSVLQMKQVEVIGVLQARIAALKAILASRGIVVM